VKENAAKVAKMTESEQNFKCFLKKN